MQDLLNFAAFTAVKFAGYSGYGVLTNRVVRQDFSSSPPSSLLVGAARTVIGLAFGLTFGYSFWTLVNRHTSFGTRAPFVFFAALVPIRVLEWWLLFRYVYGNNELTPAFYRKWVVLGVVVSFLLDAAGVYAFIITPGGAWIC